MWGELFKTKHFYLLNPFYSIVNKKCNKQYKVIAQDKIKKVTYYTNTKTHLIIFLKLKFDFHSKTLCNVTKKKMSG